MKLKNRYRIVKDNYLGFEVQIKRWWLPFWYVCEQSNTHPHINIAKEYIEKHKTGNPHCVYEEK